MKPTLTINELKNSNLYNVKSCVTTFFGRGNTGKY